MTKEEGSWTDALRGNEQRGRVQFENWKSVPTQEIPGLKNNLLMKGIARQAFRFVLQWVRASDSRKTCTQWKMGKEIGTAALLLQASLA